GSAGDASGEATTVLEGRASGWEKAPADPPCAADSPAPALDAVLARAGLTRATFGFSAQDFAESPYFAQGYLSDPFRLSWLESTRAAPARIGCFERSVAGALDGYPAHNHAVPGMTPHAASGIDRPIAAP